MQYMKSVEDLRKLSSIRELSTKPYKGTIMPELTLIKVAEQIISHADSDMSELQKDRFTFDLELLKSAVKYAEKNIKRNFTVDPSAKK